MRPLPFDLTDLQAFATVVDFGGFGRAAERSGASKSVLSRRVSQLEFALGTKLLVRDQGGARVTEAGAAFHRIAAAVLARLEQASDEALAAAAGLAGPIRITAPVSFGVMHLAPALAQFAAAHSGVAIDVRLDDRSVDLIAGGFDLGLRIGEAGGALAARRLARLRTSVVASPDYLARRGRPETVTDLAGHDVLEYSHLGFDPWRAGFGPALDVGSLTVRLRADNGEMLRDAAIAGLGLVMLPDFIVAGAVAAGRLVPILTGHALPQPGLHAVVPSGRRPLRRVRALIDHLAGAFDPEARTINVTGPIKPAGLSGASGR